MRPVAAPERAELVYAFRPIDELPEIVELAKSVGAAVVWLQSGVDARGVADHRGVAMPPNDRAQARLIVETAGLVYVDAPYIVSAVLSSH